MEKGLNKDKKSKILVFSVAYYPYLIGGAELALKEITDRIGGDMDIDMITLYAGESRLERIGNINVYRVGPKIKLVNGKITYIPIYIKLLYMFFALTKSLSLERQKNYDFIWSMMASFSGFVALFFKFIKPNKKFLLTLQEGDSLEHIEKAFGITYPISKPLYRKIFEKADMIQAISNFLGQFSRDMGSKCPIEIIPNAVDYKLFSNSQIPSQMNALRSELGISETDNVIITTSRLVMKNAIGDIIDALTYLPYNTKFLILGIGAQEALLKEKVQLLKLQDRVQFIGYVPYKEIPLYLSISNIFIRPSISEGFGNSFIEAMASGVPVIATPVGGILDFLFDNETGFFCKVKDPKSIAEKIDYITNNVDIREKVIKNARKMVSEKYDWDIIAHDMKVKVIEKI